VKAINSTTLNSQPRPVQQLKDQIAQSQDFIKTPDNPEKIQPVRKIEKCEVTLRSSSCMDGRLEEILVKMREKEDQISILRTEVSSLRDTLYKNAAETGASKNLYQNLKYDLGKMEKQLFTIEVLI